MHRPELTWIKASASMADGACVELAFDGAMIRIRDSKHPSAELRCPRAMAADFLFAVKRGEFDDLSQPEPGPA